jgi:hypothetical protein
MEFDHPIGITRDPNQILSFPGSPSSSEVNDMLKAKKGDQSSGRRNRWKHPTISSKLHSIVSVGAKIIARHCPKYGKAGMSPLRSFITELDAVRFMMRRRTSR